MLFENLTPHPLHVKTMSGDYITIPPSRRGPARVVYDTLPPEQVAYGDGKAAAVAFEVIVAGRPREIIGLPDPDDEESVVYIVAKAVADAAPRHRGDLMSPGRLIRDADGKVIGCDGLTRRA